MSGPVSRARGLLTRPGAWIDSCGDRYALRVTGDRRARVVLDFDETTFRALVDQPGLKTRRNGGWVPLPPATPPAAPPVVGAPGRIEGTRDLIQPDGGLVPVRANRGESPVAWLARRKDQSGRPWLTLAAVAAGERLRTDAEIASAGPALTMRWDALPLSSSGGGPRREPGDRAMAAERRVEAALMAAGPRLRPMLIQVCIRGSSLQLAEQEQGLRRRQGRSLLKEGLAALADHYRIG